MPAFSSIERTCEVCGKAFMVQPYRIRNGKPGGRFCGRDCQSAWRKGKTFHSTYEVSNDEVIAQYASGKTLKEVGDLYGMTLQAVYSRLHNAGVACRKPTGEALNRPDVRANSRANHVKGPQHPEYRALPMEDIKTAYEGGHTLTRLSMMYKISVNSLAEKLRAIGVIIRPSHHRGLQACSDGHSVQSVWEWAVDEWLSQHGIAHQVQPPCPWPLQHPVSHQEADFLVNDTYIEVLGMRGRPQYDERQRRKMLQYEAANIPLIRITSHQISAADYSPLEVLLP